MQLKALGIRLSVLIVVGFICTSGTMPRQATGPPIIALDVNSGFAGATVTITGSGWPAHEIVALYIDHAPPYIGQPGPVADVQGNFSQTIKLPGHDYDSTGLVDPARPGPHQICGDTGYPGSTQVTKVNACATFTVLPGPSPTASLSPAVPQPPVPASVPVPIILLGLAVLAAAVAGLLFLTRKAP